MCSMIVACKNGKKDKNDQIAMDNKKVIQYFAQTPVATITLPSLQNVFINPYSLTDHLKQH